MCVCVCVCTCMHVCLYVCILRCFSCVQLFLTVWTIPCQAPHVHGILQTGILEWVAMPSSIYVSLSLERDIYFKKLSHMIMGSVKSEIYWVAQ